VPGGFFLRKKPPSQPLKKSTQIRKMLYAGAVICFGELFFSNPESEQYESKRIGRNADGI
jgi:hypothetical protein